MMNLTHVVAASTNNAIGKGGQLLWHLPKDLNFFKNVTWGMPVVMGRKTFESVGKVLPGRTNIVITSQPDWKHEGVVTASSLKDAIAKAGKTNCLETFIIGGGEIYRQTMEMVHRIYMTRVHAEIEGDTFYPEMNCSWKLKHSLDFDKDEKHAYSFTIETWESSSTPIADVLPI